MTQRYFAFLFCLILFANSCEKDDNASATFSEYPSAIGNSWTYKTEITLIIDADTTIFIHDHYWFVEKDTTIDGMLSFVIYKEDTAHNIQTKLKGKAYYTNQADGFYQLAIKGHGSGGITLKKGENSFLESCSTFFPFSNQQVDHSDSVYFLDTPSKHLQFPITVNDQWVSILPPQPVKPTNRQYISFENVTVPAGTFNCVKVALTSQSFQDSEMTVVQYISKYGLIKQVQKQNALVFSDSLGNFSTGTSTSTTELISKNF